MSVGLLYTEVRSKTPQTTETSSIYCAGCYSHKLFYLKTVLYLIIKSAYMICHSTFFLFVPFIRIILEDFSLPFCFQQVWSVHLGRNALLQVSISQVYFPMNLENQLRSTSKSHQYLDMKVDAICHSLLDLQYPTVPAQPYNVNKINVMTCMYEMNVHKYFCYMYSNKFIL